MFFKFLLKFQLSGVRKVIAGTLVDVGGVRNYKIHSRISDNI